MEESPNTTVIPQRMAEKLKTGRARDVRKDGQEDPSHPGHFILDVYMDDVDYCDGKTGQWIWSIGRQRDFPKLYVASLRGDLYQNPDYECVWLR